ncbi:hypothetical protein [Verrucosispora sp. WMMC514]|uniref:hypothetical protein n=1 Tax=Verrucosispora sp. WMMC514 TaxID=3015156 RepID=UPI00248C2B39|nr:hypothetical protein [Verrucosispora sp. WMMC514]WBB92349.1 hypothetical protein O7597_04905 [Verrucosispora sp. WMMC514]
MSIRATRLAVTLAVAAASVLVGSGPAAAAGSAGYCPDAAGVTVVVDFKELGGGTVVRCAPGDQATGLAALKAAGFRIAGTLRWGEGFICRIEGKPSASTEKCVDTPPASAYWSYWHAPNGGTWTYSDKGVLNRKPPSGSFEGWSFSLNRNADSAPRPGVAPARPAPPPRTTPPAPPPPAPRTSAPAMSGGTPPAGFTLTPPVAAATATPSGSSSVPTTAATAPPLAAAPVAPSADPTDSYPATEFSATRDTDGLPLGTVAGVLLLVALAGGGLVAARRRRTAEPDD